MVVMARKKGYIYTIEVLIAVSIIFFALYFLYRSPIPETEIELAMIKQQGFYALDYMSDHDYLDRYIANDDEYSIEQFLKSVISPSINFETEICSQICEDTNVPANTTVVSVDYYVSGYKSSYLGKKLKMWLWL